jgi:hypothetical protein
MSFLRRLFRGFTRVGKRAWTLELPSGWESDEGDPVVSMFHPNGVGALQISAFFRRDSIGDKDLRDLADERLATSPTPEPVNLGAFTGLQVTYVDDGTFWSRWYVRHGHQALLITYNCLVADRGSEFDEVKRVLLTLKAIDP